MGLFDSVSELLKGMNPFKVKSTKKKDTTSRDEILESIRAKEDACDRCLRRSVGQITAELSKAGVRREKPMNMSKIANNPALAFSGDYTYKTEEELEALIESKKPKSK